MNILSAIRFFGRMRVPENQIGEKFIFTGFFLKVTE